MRVEHNIYNMMRRRYEEHRHSRIRERLPGRRVALTIRSQPSAEAHRPLKEGISTKVKRAVEKQPPPIRKVDAKLTSPDSSAEIHKPEEEEPSTMAEIDARSPEAKLTDWLSKLFEQLDLRNSTDKLAQVETHLHVEEVVSPETHTSSKGKDSIMANVDSCLDEEEELPNWMSELFERLDTEMNDDRICSTGKVADAEIHSSTTGGGSVLFEKLDIEDSGYSTGKVSATDGISSEINRANVDFYYSSDAEDEFDEWMLKMAKMGANDDMSYLYKVDQEEKHPVHFGQLDGYDLMVKEVEDYPKNMKKFSYRETIQNGFNWMSEECFVAFKKYAENLNLVGIEHKFGEIRHQCFNVESDGKTFHHFNFTIDAKHESSDTWISEEYFAEVKQEFGIKSYFCHLLELNDKGDCNGCKSQDVSKLHLRHPNGGGYKQGDADICWPFEVDTDCDSDSSDDVASSI